MKLFLKNMLKTDKLEKLCMRARPATKIMHKNKMFMHNMYGWGGGVYISCMRGRPATKIMSNN